LIGHGASLPFSAETARGVRGELSLCEADGGDKHHPFNIVNAASILCRAAA
jgi:hypothetical protein